MPAIPVAVPVKSPAVNAVQSVHEMGVAQTLVETKKATVKKTRLVVIGLVTFVPSMGTSPRAFSCTAQTSGLPAGCKSLNSFRLTLTESRRGRGRLAA